MSNKPWGGRFSEKTAKIVEAFSSSIDIDKRLYAHDIDGSVAHCRMLAKQGIITEAESSTLVEGLGGIKREIERGEFQTDDSLEDIHMHIEARLLRAVGKVARKLHTARSRNDQVALDERMYLRQESGKIIGLLHTLRSEIVKLARTHMGVVMPGYTHLQRAQPVLFSHHMLAYYEMFSRDTRRFNDALVRINVMPLGSAALAGTTYPIDRHYTAQLLDFPEVSANSIDSVSDRDFIIEFMAAASLCMVHFSRFSEELILWSSSEFGFIELSDAFTTGSSIMPQKKNPDVPELVRGKTGLVFGNLMAMLTVMKSLPLAYNRDMQEDKKPLFDTVDTLKACIEVYENMLPTIKVNKQVMQQATETGFINATDLADYLVTRGMPFREAHGCSGKAVGYAISQHKELQNLSLNELKAISPLFEEEVFDILTLRQMIDRRKSFGGTASENVLAAMQTAENDLKKEEIQSGREKGKPLMAR
ncbi:MAG: argininosuccinate lyase [Desulfobacterales bacterium]|nr:argininosuccinate lyase [Desulfobacterales bacterium]MDD4392538.1 argininosuccinate lyase [Desulfobacterales bacterium]